MLTKYERFMRKGQMLFPLQASNVVMATPVWRLLAIKSASELLSFASGLGWGECRPLISVLPSACSSK